MKRGRERRVRRDEMSVVRVDCVEKELDVVSREMEWSKVRRE